MTTSNKSFKSIKINMFFFFLLLAIIFWALTKFSKENTAKIFASITYQNFPERYLLGDENPENVDFYITTNGIDFLVYKMKQPTIAIDVSKYFNSETKKAVLSDEELKEELAKQIGYTGVVRNISEKGINIQLQGIQSKKIPVLVKAKIQYNQGFRALDTINARPDSIVVTGPLRFLDSITSVYTEDVVIDNVSENVSEVVALQPFPYEGLISKTKSVTLSQEVMEFAQKKLSLPVSVENVPANTVIKLIPKRVTISCVMPVEKFASVTESDFKVICDYTERNKAENFLSPKLIQSPSFAKNIEILPKKIDFLIFKK